MLGGESSYAQDGTWVRYFGNYAVASPMSGTWVRYFGFLPILHLENEK